MTDTRESRQQGEQISLAGVQQLAREEPVTPRQIQIMVAANGFFVTVWNGIEYEEPMIFTDVGDLVIHIRTLL